MNKDDTLVLIELDKMEKLSKEYEYELKYLSKRIRKDIWISGKNSKKLGFYLNKINYVFAIMKEIVGEDIFFSISTIMEYVRNFARFSIFYNPNLDDTYFKNLMNDIELKNAERIIEQQWNDIYYAEDGYKNFMEIFDDVFTNCINLHKDKFFHNLNDSDILCRVVKDWNHKKDRFIPRPSKTNNRWNPKGRQFLYLSFGQKNVVYSTDLSLNEFICLEEYKAKKGNKYSFCNFKPNKVGKIFDLSYNDISVSSIKNIIEDYRDSSVEKMVDELLSNPNANKIYKNKKILKKDIKSLMNKNPIDKSIIEESFAKQYLKMICSCIYKKVDETDENEKELAYKSFHILSEYLESKGVTGIIYPCTRTNKVVGKNLVLFNAKDAEPIETSIREYIYL